MNVGDIRIEGGLVLAPLAGITDLPFRIIARRCGAGLVCSEMISANGLLYRNRSTTGMLATVAEERPVSFQLFGSDSGIMGEAASVLDALPIDVIDINMGCPVRKVVSKDAGSALLKDLPLAGRIIRSVVRNTRHPVTIKIRLGWDEGSFVAGELARMAEAEGIAAVIVHGRTSRQMFRGSVDLAGIRRVREAVSIPVIGNGDVRTPADIIRMREVTGCQAVMIGRAAVGNPWIFSRTGGPPEAKDRLVLILEHLALMEKHLSEREAFVQARNHTGWYAKGIPGAAQLRKHLFETRTVEEVRGLAVDFFSRAGREPGAGSSGHPHPFSGASPE